MGILIEPEWLEYGLTNRVTGDNDPKYGTYGTINECPRTLWNHRKQANSLIDSVLYVYKNTTTITLNAGGIFGNSDGSRLYEIESAVDVSTSTDLTAADTLTAGVFYYIWGGEEAGGSQIYVLSDDSAVMPSELTKGRCLRGGISIWDNGGTEEITPFNFDGRFYEYSVTAIGASGEQNSVFSGTLTTTFLDVDCSALVPAGCQRVRCIANCGTNNTSHHFYRCNGASHSGIQHGNLHYSYVEPYNAFVDTAGVYEAKNSASVTTYITLIGFFLRG